MNYSQPVYENLNRGTSARGSLKRRNSSVKDLIKKLERPKTLTTMGASAAKRQSPPRNAREEEAAAAEDEEWVDAESFFKNPLPPPPPAMAKTPMGGNNKRASAVPHYMQQHQAFEDFDSGCKRSSIIRYGVTQQVYPNETTPNMLADIFSFNKGSTKLNAHLTFL